MGVAEVFVAIDSALRERQTIATMPFSFCWRRFDNLAAAAKANGRSGVRRMAPLRRPIIRLRRDGQFAGP